MAIRGKHEECLHYDPHTVHTGERDDAQEGDVGEGNGQRESGDHWPRHVLEYEGQVQIPHPILIHLQIMAHVCIIELEEERFPNI